MKRMDGMRCERKGHPQRRAGSGKGKTKERDMKRCMKNAVLRGFCFLAAVSALHAGDIGRGGYAGSYLRMGLGARDMSMGGGSAALGIDAYTMFTNPSGLVFLEGHHATATANAMALDRRLFFLGYGQSVGGGKAGLFKAGLALGWLCAGVQNIDARNFDGVQTGDLSFWENCFILSFAFYPAEFVSIGLNLKVLYSIFPGITDAGEGLSSSGLGLDFGLTVRPLDNVRAGLVIKDVMAKHTWDSQSLYERGTQTVNPFLRSVRGGVAACFFKKRLTAVLDLEKIEYNPLVAIAGLEFEAARGVFVRCGLHGGTPSLGAGVRITVGTIAGKIDYGFVPDPVAPWPNHIFTWSFIF